MLLFVLVGLVAAQTTPTSTTPTTPPRPPRACKIAVLDVETRGFAAGEDTLVRVMSDALAAQRL
ncbi:MAG: hypothetical protein Q8O67_10995 [Deltaproteobacteria bacterium]|nr:hypothetical protein [Deltaproteobacteria bacterium]